MTEPSVGIIELFPRNRIVGVFRGFREGGLEFHADLALPYQSFFHNVPMHGQFILVQLETPDEGVLGRITSLTSEGRLAGQTGEEFTIRSLRDERDIPEQLRRDYLKYRVTIRVLGLVRNDEGAVRFVPSHRRLPHVGSPVAFLSDDALRQLVGHFGQGAPLGVFALGEYVYSGGNPEIETMPWMQIRSPAVLVRFPVQHLVSRRTFVFARAGFGKSNLNKLLFSKLYERTPVVEKRGERQVPVGTIIFDPDGEYFWPDDKGRPGLCDVPDLKDQLVVFTSRQAPSPFYGSFVAGGIKLDIRRLQPTDVVSIALSPEKQDQQNVRKLRSLNPTAWGQLVDLVHEHGNAADLDMVQELLHLERDQQIEALAARANITAVVRMLHDPNSQLMDMLLQALSEGKLCVVDLSQLRGGPSLILAGLILRKIFDHNQDEFTKAAPRTIPTIAVIEEAQTVLSGTSSTTAPFIEWVKEGRKYDLGAMLITQQPGSIPPEILSQGDNWFIFHLLSTTDLTNVKKANAHFSDDLLSALLNEPIPGQGLFWSSVGGSPFPIPIRAVAFETLYPRQDQAYARGSVSTYASSLRLRVALDVQTELITSAERPADEGDGKTVGHEEHRPDAFRALQKRAVESLKTNDEFRMSMENDGIPWGKVVGILKESLPETMVDRDTVAYNLVPEAVSEALKGSQGEVWGTERRGKKNTTFIVKRK